MVPSRCGVITYSEIGDPPSPAGGVQLTLVLDIPTGDAATSVGGEGGVVDG